jgi:hypothetical protein
MNDLFEDTWNQNPEAQTDATIHQPGAKADAGKSRLGLVMLGFVHALWEVGLVGTAGAIKYSDFGFLQVPNGEDRYEDAGLRHQFKRWMDEEYDPEDNALHLAHEAWNALAKLELYLRRKKGVVNVQ